MSTKVLLIDDDENLLSGLKRQYRKKFDLLTATSGKEGIKLLEEHAPVGVVVSDMRMPDMDGLETLKMFKEKSPNTVRIMLTGNADQQTTIDAVNEGEVFKFFNKPCPPETLEWGIKSALRQYQLIIAEKELLEQTLAGTIKFLVDLLAFSKPVAFARSTRIREWIKQILPKINIEEPWQLDFAAMLLPLCDLIVPIEIEQKIEKNMPLGEHEQELLRQAPHTIRNMLMQIPRISCIADIIETAKDEAYCHNEDTSIEAKLLVLLDDLAKETTDLFPTIGVFETLLLKKDKYDPELFQLMQSIFLNDDAINIYHYETVVLPIGVLKPQYTLVDNLCMLDGRLLLSQGTVLSEAHVKKLYSFIQNENFPKTVRVLRVKKTDDNIE